MAAKKKIAKRVAKKKVAKKAAKKKVTATKRVAKKAAKKKTASKRVSAKKAAKKKTAAKPRALSSSKPKGVAKKATKKVAAKRTPAKAAKKKAAVRRSASASSEVDAPTPSAPAPSAPRQEESDVPARSEGRPAAGGLRRGTRRQVGPRRVARPEPSNVRDIPPLPEEDDDFIPAAPSAKPAPAGRAPRRSRPAALLDRVRSGRAHISTLNRLTDEEVLALAQEAGLEPEENDRSSEILFKLVNDERPTPGRRGPPRRERVEREAVRVEGLLELHPDGYGFLRRSERNYSQHPEDVYVAAGIVRKLNLQPGHWIAGQAHRPRPGQAYLALHDVEEVNHESPDKLTDMTPFKDLTVVYPDTRLQLETGPDDIEMRIMDLFCPLGLGQRALIVAPPRTGKTVLMTKLADAVAANSPNVDIVVLLVDERPEEVTNMRRSVRGEVIASTFDKPATNHVRVAELVMDKVRRMVEFGRDVVLLLDSITRLGRAYNNQTGGSGRILSGGLDANALSKPKRFFGSARNVEGGGSLTIVATALIDTGSRLDQVIFEEFKGTGNMEVVLSRDLANARVWPAIDVPASGTRNEDLLLHPDELQRVIMLRRGITGQEPLNVMQALRVQMKKHTTNAQFLMGLGEGKI